MPETLVDNSTSDNISHHHHKPLRSSHLGVVKTRTAGQKEREAVVGAMILQCLYMCITYRGKVSIVCRICHKVLMRVTEPGDYYAAASDHVKLTYFAGSRCMLCLLLPLRYQGHVLPLDITCFQSHIQWSSPG